MNPVQFCCFLVFCNFVKTPLASAGVFFLPLETFLFLCELLFFLVCFFPPKKGENGDPLHSMGFSFPRPRLRIFFFLGFSRFPFFWRLVFFPFFVFSGLVVNFFF